jgi:hypothetical protein
MGDRFAGHIHQQVNTGSTLLWQKIIHRAVLGKLCGRIPHAKARQRKARRECGGGEEALLQKAGFL